MTTCILPNGMSHALDQEEECKQWLSITAQKDWLPDMIEDYKLLLLLDHKLQTVLHSMPAEDYKPLSHTNAQLTSKVSNASQTTPTEPVSNQQTPKQLSVHL